jgi:hypothetical protein
LCASLFVRPSQNWNHAILDIKLFAGAENTNTFSITKVPATLQIWLTLLRPIKMEELAQQQTHVVGTFSKPVVHHLRLPSLPLRQPSTHQIFRSFLTLLQSGETKVKISSTTRQKIEV